MAKFVMMSMVFTLVLLKSAAVPMGLLMGEGIWAKGSISELKNWATDKQFFSGQKISINLAPDSNVKRVTRAAFDACDTVNAVEDGITIANGLANVTLESGANYFICTIADHCNLGLKLSAPVLDDTLGASPSLTPPTTTASDTTGTHGSSSPAVSVGVLVPLMVVALGFFF